MSRATPVGPGRCQHCGKWSFLTRKEAKRAARTMNDPSLNAYVCVHTPAGFEPYWHLGHLPSCVTRGVLPRSAIYTGKRDIR